MARYAVIDSAQQGGFYKRLDKYGLPYRSLFDGYAEANLPEIAPLLVLLSETDSQQRRVHNEIQRIAVQRPAISLLESVLPLDELAEHLRAFHTVKLPGRRMMILRWYDTRVLPDWMDALDPSQRAGFTRGIDRWSYYDRFGDERELALPPGSAFPSLTPYELDDAQYAALREACEADALIAHLRSIIRDELSGLPIRALYPFVDEHLQQARLHGLGGLDDQTQFLLLALYTSGRCLEHHEVALRLAVPAGAHGNAFQDWMDALPDEAWLAGQPLWASATRVQGVAV